MMSTSSNAVPWSVAVHEKGEKGERVKGWGEVRFPVIIAVIIAGAMWPRMPLLFRLSWRR